MARKKIIIIGGGLAGLISSLHLTRAGVPCTVIEKKSYPFHRVCGEYISNEVIPYLKSLDAFPEEVGPSQINSFHLTSVNGKMASLPLDLGGFGISRYQLDYFLFRKAKQEGVEFLLNSEVHAVVFQDEHFIVKSTTHELNADIVAGTFGKRSKLDVQLHRSFVQRRSPYVGVKYHIRLADFPSHLIELHNFKDGYCGISRVEGDRINLCYLTHRNNLKMHGSIRNMEEAVLFQNPFLKKIFSEAEFFFDKPETINEISFETKSPVEEHILMGGDSAGMITPLCGNGMAMAIHSAKILSEHLIRYYRDPSYSRTELENDYANSWSKEFAKRLWAGRQIQRLFGRTQASNFAVFLANHVTPVADFLLRKTHGNSF